LSQQIMPGRASDSWFIHPNDYTALFAFGQRATMEQAPSEKTKIYVSRKNSKRALPEEAQLEDLLRSQGFFIAHLESMAWTDQISLFQGADVVVAPHGAGLANLVFTNPGALVIELTNGYHYNRCFEWICHIAAHSYKKIDADSEAQPLQAHQLAEQISNFLE
jgi:capsular polysaccharide biosynthesis protein